MNNTINNTVRYPNSGNESEWDLRKLNIDVNIHSSSSKKVGSPAVMDGNVSET